MSGKISLISLIISLLFFSFNSFLSNKFTTNKHNFTKSSFVFIALLLLDFKLSNILQITVLLLKLILSDLKVIRKHDIDSIKGLKGNFLDFSVLYPGISINLIYFLKSLSNLISSKNLIGIVSTKYSLLFSE